MKTSRLLSVIACTLGLSGCFLPSGVNPTLGCSPILGCTERDYYLPGKGVWAPKPVTFGKKAQIGAVVGTALLAARAKDKVKELIEEQKVDKIPAL